MIFHSPTNRPCSARSSRFRSPPPAAPQRAAVASRQWQCKACARRRSGLRSAAASVEVSRDASQAGQPLAAPQWIRAGGAGDGVSTTADQSAKIAVLPVLFGARTRTRPCRRRGGPARCARLSCRQRLNAARCRSAKGYGSSGSRMTSGSAVRHVVQFDDGISFGTVGTDVVAAGAVQQVVGVGVAVERHPGLAPDRAEDAPPRQMQRSARAALISRAMAAAGAPASMARPAARSRPRPPRGCEESSRRQSDLRR